MTSYNGEAISYDAVGNPVQYRDGMTITWQNGRELATLTKDGKTISYSYNADGIRTEKNNNGVVTKYFYDSNNNLISLICGDIQLVFYYDADGQADSFTVYSGNTATRYYYVKNLQGDITKIMTADGAVVANYYYDAYGEILSITDADGDQITDASSVAFLNPLRYRGYVYDDDTGFYYLQSRYYDPITKRFINADDVFYLGVSGNITGYNLFSYCCNNPVNCVDKTGYVVTPANVIGAVIGAVGGAVIGYAIANYFRLTGWKRWACTASVSLLLGVVGYIAGPAIYAAVKPIIVKAITACTIVINKSQEWVLRALGVAQTYINQALRLVNSSTIKFTSTVLKYLNDSSRKVPIKTLIDCIKTGKARPDPQGTKAIMYTITNFYKNGKRYNLEVLFDWSKMTVLHFKYWR